ncbi:uncharacterized protein BXZ73DRAFT_38972 [Epithele typhae]|uniref:uncharacterized protein n=1 Tax=Epithele typhae TaxID=378194 RepID=UPI002008BD49|nr:uncharacterized protein BXZ73DRAFT_38972 [Epithele typhae]KAH9945027.1 hypothetical protein BXZ73DRAFT_38972 [Epithele typhae]
MAAPDSWLKILDRLDLHLRAYEDEGISDEADPKPRCKRFTRALEDVCTVVRDAERKGCSDLPQLVEKAQQVLSDALRYAYSEESGFSSLSSFAHSEDEPLVEDALDYAGSDILDAFMSLYRLMHPGASAPKLPAFAKMPSWVKSPHPHPLTTRLSRFRGGFSPSASSATPLAHTIYQARAQLTVDSIASAPSDMSISSGGSILALSIGSGWKARDPHLQYYLLGEQSKDYLQSADMETGLSSVADFIVTDESRKLVFLADPDRVKSFSFAPNPATGKTPRHLPTVHTLDSERAFNGPILVLPNGRLARTAHGRAAIWNLDELETQSVPTTSMSFGEDDLTPSVLHLHQPTQHVLYGTHDEAGGRFACAMVDMEAGGRRITRFLGHGGDVERISTDEGSPNLFVTASNDGYARIFDVRHPLPVLTFSVEQQRQACADVVLVHPNGVPTLFTGGARSHQVKLWDIRAEECVYELSTGNNEVTGLAWDSARSSLFVATECTYVDRMGTRLDYRRARVPHWASWKAVNAEFKTYREAVKRGEVIPESTGQNEYPDVYDDYLSDGDGSEETELEDEEDDVDEEYSADMRWPKRTFHKENFFGYAYDAGEHVLFRWQYKDLPDISQLPASTGFD